MSRPHSEDWVSPFSRPNYVLQSFPRMLWGLAHRVVSSQQTVSVPTNRVKSASRYTWSSFQQRVYSHDSHVCPSPSFKATAQQQSRPKTCCPLPARATKRPAGSPRVERPGRTLVLSSPRALRPTRAPLYLQPGSLASPLLQFHHIRVPHGRSATSFSGHP